VAPVALVVEEPVPAKDETEKSDACSELVVEVTYVIVESTLVLRKGTGNLKEHSRLAAGPARPNPTKHICARTRQRIACKSVDVE